MSKAFISALGHSLFALLCFLSSTSWAATTCSSTFLQAVQSHSAGTVTFGSGAYITNPSEKKEIIAGAVVSADSGSCGDIACKKSLLDSVDEFSPGSFQVTNLPNNDFYTPDDGFDIGSAGDGTHYGVVELLKDKGDKTLYFSADHDTYYMEQLIIGAGTTVSMPAGTYWIGSLDFDFNQGELLVDGEGIVNLFVRDSLLVDKNTTINGGASGDPKQLFIYSYGDIEFSEQNAKVAGLMYAANNIELGESFELFGSVTATDVTLKSNAQLTYVEEAVDTICGGGSSADHFTLAYSASSAIICDSTGITLTVTAKDSAGTTLSTYAEEITLSLPATAPNVANGNWALAQGGGSFSNGTSNDGQASYSFIAADGGSAQFTLTYSDGTPAVPVAGSVTPYVYQTSDSSIRDNQASGAINFVPNGFTITAQALANPLIPPLDKVIPAQIAGTDFDLHIAAYGQTEDDPSCGIIESFAGSKSLSLWMTRSNPGVGAPVGSELVMTRNAAVLGDGESSATSHAISFSAGQATLSLLKFKDVGLIGVGAKESALLRGLSNNFVSYPASLSITSIVESADYSNSNPGTSSATGTVFMRAGDNFDISLEVQDAEGDPTPSFGNESEGIGFTSTLTLPSGGTNPGLSLNTESISDGVHSSEQYWDEVGAISVQAQIKDGDYLGIGTTLTAAITRPVLTVGRFIPAYFALAANAPLFNNGLGGTSCTFTYQGQDFDYATSPQLSFTAMSARNSITTNYGNELWRLNSSLAGRSYSDQAVQGATPVAALLQVDSTAATVSLSGDNNLDGVGVLTLSGDEFQYSKATIRPSTLDVPFQALADLDFSAADLSDLDGACYLNGTASCQGFSISAITGTQLRFGRLTLEPVFGPEVLPLSMPARIEYWDDSAGTEGFVANVADTCTTLSLSASTAAFEISQGAFSGNLDSGETTSSWGGFTAAEGFIGLSAPGSGNEGSLRISLTAPSGHDYLLYDWFTLGTAVPPSATATFGINAGRQPIIYQREILR